MAACCGVKAKNTPFGRIRKRGMLKPFPAILSFQTCSQSESAANCRFRTRPDEERPASCRALGHKQVAIRLLGAQLWRRHCGAFNFRAAERGQAAFLSAEPAGFPQHRLYFRPELQGQGAFRGASFGVLQNEPASGAGVGGVLQNEFRAAADGFLARAWSTIAWKSALAMARSCSVRSSAVCSGIC